LARQVSKRGGELYCEAIGERVAIGGKAVIYFEGEIHLDIASSSEARIGGGEE
jgi:hypothetical protein